MKKVSSDVQVIKKVTKPIDSYLKNFMPSNIPNLSDVAVHADQKTLMDEKQNIKMVTQMIFQTCKDQDRDLTSTEKQKVIDLNKGAVFHLARKLYFRNKAVSEFDDFVQAGNIGLFEAIKRYDIQNTRQASFFSYSFYHVQNEMNKVEVKSKMIHIPYKKKRDGLKYHMCSFEEYFTNVFKTESKQYEIMKRAEVLKMIKEKVDAQQYQMIALRFGLDVESFPNTPLGKPRYEGQTMTLKEVGENMEIDHVSSKFGTIFKKLQPFLRGNGINCSEDLF